MRDTVRFSILGLLTVEGTSGHIAVTAPKQRALLILLLINAGRVLSADVILDLLWPSAAPSAGTKTVRFHISKLRAALEPDVHGSGFDVLETRGAGYVIDPDKHEIDSRRFEQLALAGRRELGARPDRAQRLLTEALSLWSGRALQDVAYENFASVEAHRLENLRLGTIEDRISSELRLGRTAGLVPELEQLVELHPARERTTELLMQALYAAGRTADAIAAGQRVRQSLGELGLEPQPSLVRLEEQILLHDSALATASHAARDRQHVTELPGRLSSFIGRTSEIDEVTQRIADERWVTLVGPPGAGKSSLAVEVGRNVTDHFDDGVAWVGLADVTDGRLVAQTFGVALGIGAPVAADYMRLVVKTLEGRALLLVVDNCEHVLEDVAQLIVAILEACPDVSVLATSREVLGAPGEHTWAVPPFELPRNGNRSLDAIGSVDSVRLFVHRAQEATAHFELNAANVTDVATICRTLDGLPLAIELAASATEALSVPQIAQRLTRRSVDVPSVVRHGASRQATMEAAIRWSYNLLSPKAQAVFRRLSVFSGGFTMDSAVAVAGRTTVDRSEVFDIVIRLIQKSLLIPTHEDHNTVRYRMLTVLRQFGQRELEATGETPTIDAGHAQYFVGIAEAIAPFLEGMSASRGRDIADRELDNFRAAMESCLGQGDIEMALRIDAALTWYWYWRSYLNEGYEWGTRILAAADGRGETPARAQVLYSVGIFGNTLGLYPEANVAFEAAGQMAKALGNEALEARALTGRGVNAKDSGHLASARTHFGEAETIDRRIGDSTHLALTLRFAGMIQYMLGDLERAGAAANEAYDLFRRQGHRGGMGWALGTQARIAFRSHGEAGFALAARAAELYEEVHDRRNGAWLLLRTAVAQSRLGADDEARKGLAESRAIFVDLDDRRGLGYADQQAGQIELRMRSPHRAAELLSGSIDLFEQIGDYGGLAGTHGWLAVHAVLVGNDADVATHLSAWLTLPAEDRSVWSALDIITELSRALVEMIGPVAPIEQLSERLSLALTSGDGVAGAIRALDETPQLCHEALAESRRV